MQQDMEVEPAVGVYIQWALDADAHYCIALTFYWHINTAEQWTVIQQCGG